MSRNIGTVLGFAIILAGFALCGWAVWWLATEGDIIQIVHDLKMHLPAWAWSLLRLSLTALVGVCVLGIFFILGIAAFGIGKKR